MGRQVLTRSVDRAALWFLIAVAAIAVLVPLLNLAVPRSSVFHVSTYLVALFGKYACYALLALSIDLIWGFCGILSLGHGAFFTLGGYAMGMYLMRQIGTRGSYANPILPDFMVFLNWKELPVYWYGFQHFPYAALMIVLVPGVLAFVFGWFAFRSRVTGVYLSIITQALTYALMLGFFRNNFGFGGNNGLTDFKDILGFNVQSEITRDVLFSISCLTLIVGFLVCRAIVTSKFGKVLIAIRDAEARTRFLGYRVESYKLFVFTLSACMAGIAGALYVPQVGIINPSEFAPGNSIEAVIWVAVGGRGTLSGAVLGAVLVNYAKTYFTSGALAPYWLFMLGGLFITVTLLLPRGVIGAFTDPDLRRALRTWLRALRTCLRNYAGFSRRAPRYEFWCFELFLLLLSLVALVVEDFVKLPLVAAVAIAFALPHFAVMVRRLHDIDRSGWWALIGAVPILNLVLLVWLGRRGTLGKNRFGPDDHVDAKDAARLPGDSATLPDPSPRPAE